MFKQQNPWGRDLGKLIMCHDYYEMMKLICEHKAYIFNMFAYSQITGTIIITYAKDTFTNIKLKDDDQISNKYIYIIL